MAIFAQHKLLPPFVGKGFRSPVPWKKNKKSGKKRTNGISNGMASDEDQYFKILRAFYDKPCHFQNFGFFLFYCVVAVVLVLVLAVVMDVVVVLLLLLLLSHTSSLFSLAASWYILVHHLNQVLGSHWVMKNCSTAQICHMFLPLAIRLDFLHLHGSNNQRPWTIWGSDTAFICAFDGITALNKLR